MELVRQHRLISDLHLKQTKNADPTTTTNSTDNKNSSKGLSNPAFCPDAENPDDASDDGNKYETIQTFPSKSSSHETSQKRNGKDYRGIALALFSSVCFSLVVLIVKVLSRDYGVDPYGASFWRFTGTVLPTVPIFLYFEFCSGGKRDTSSTLHTLLPIRAKWETWAMLLGCGVIGSTSVILRYHALRYLTIADTLVITYAAPVLVTLLAHCFLGERCGVFPIIVALGTFLGVVIVAKPPLLTGATEFDSGSMLGTGFACGSLLCVTLSTIATRKLREVHFTVTIIVLGIIGVAQALIMTSFTSSGHFNFPTGKNDACLIAALAGLSFLAQVAWITALKFEDAGPISLIRCCDAIFGFIFQYAFLSVVPDIFSSVGAAVVLSGVLLTGFRKWLGSLPPEDKRRQRWWLILT